MFKISCLNLERLLNNQLEIHRGTEILWAYKKQLVNENGLKYSHLPNADS